MWRVPGKDHNRPAVFTKVVSGVLLAALAIAGYFLYDIYTSRAFAGGTGTPADPYIISDCTELQEMDDVPEYMMASFELSANIDCSAVALFDPIGNYNSFDGSWLPFMGRFDGQGYTISNVTIGSTTSFYNGLFANMEGASVRDVTLDNFSVDGTTYLGALVGSARESAIIGVSVINSTITSHSNSGGSVGGVVGNAGSATSLYGIQVASTTITSTASSTSFIHGFGGIVGQLAGFSVLDRSTSSTTISVNMQGVGGLVGKISYGAIIINSYSEGSTTGYNYVGGIVGSYETFGTDTYVDSVYSKGSTVATNPAGSVGGIHGSASGAGSAVLSIANSFAVGYVSSTTYSGGISGQGFVPASRMKNNVYYPTGTGQTRCTATAGPYTAGQCTSNDTSSYYNSSLNAPLSSWNFTNIWSEVPSDRPELQIFPYAEPSSATSIGTCAALASAVRANPVGWFELSGNIDCSNDASLVPLTGNMATSSNFFGIFDGQGFTVNGVGTSKTATAQYQYGLGLFNKVSGATIRDVTLAGTGPQALYDGVDRVGALAGSGMGVWVENLTSTVPVTTGEQFGGGLLGFGSGVFNNVTVNADVDNVSTDSYGYWTAGLIGDAVAVQMNNVEYNGNITTYWYSGALIGFAEVVQITNATTTGNFVGNVIAAGMVGSVGETDGVMSIKSTIDNAHSSMNFDTNAAIDNYLERVGGIVGYSQAGVDISNSSYTGTITNSDSNWAYLNLIGGIAGDLSTDSNSATSTITNSFTNAYITVPGNSTNSPYAESVGGMVGEAGYVEITDSTASTTMVFGGNGPTEYFGGLDNIGGLVGMTQFSLLDVSDTQANGSITVYDDITGSNGGYGWGLGGFGGYFGSAIIQNSTSSVDIYYQSYEPGAVSNFVGDLEYTTVRNVVVDGDLTIDAYENPYYVGGMAGYADTATIATSTVTGDITMTNTLWPYSIGGLIGYMDSSNIIQETYTDSVITINTGTDGSSAGPYAVGGFIGEINSNNTMRDTYASTAITITSSALGTVYSGGNAGGYAGYIGWSGNSITNSYATGILTINTDITSPFQRIGGFIGWSANNTNTYNDLFAVMDIQPIASSTNVGGFIGRYTGSETFSNIFFDATKTGQSLCSGIDGTDPVWCTVHNVANSEPTYFFDATNAPMSSWNFTTTWLEHPDTYPTFGVGGGGGGGPTAPTLTTNATASGVTQTAATLAGTITDLGSAAVTARGIVYGTTPFFSATSTENSAGFSTGAFSRNITSLVCGTTYYFAAYASSADGLSYGATESFSTSACATTPPPSSGSSSAGTKVKDKKSDTAVLTKTDSITICHSGDGSKYVTLTNVQVFITLAQSGATAELRGHDGHGADIVPAFLYDFGDGVHTYPGVNWTTENQKLFANNCEKFLAIPPTPVPTPVPTPAPEPAPEPPIVLPPLDEPITVCDSVSVYTRVSVAPDTNTTVVTTVPQGAVKSKKTEETGKKEYQLTLTVQPVEAKRADALTQKFTDILVRFKEKQSDDKKDPYGIVKKLSDTPKKETAYQSFTTTTAESTSAATTNSTAALIENPIPVVTTGDCDTATPESEPPVVPTPPPAPEPEVTPSPTPDTETPDTTTPPTPTDETVAPPEVPAVIVSDTLTEENIADWLPEDVLPEDAELLVPPIQVAVETPEGEYLEVFESPVTIDVTNPAVAGLTENDLIILQPSADGTQWYEVPYTIDSDTLHITVSRPGEIFVWFIPKQALAAEESGVAGTLTPLIDIEIPLIVVKLLSYFGLGAGVAYALMQLSRTPVSASTFRRSLLEGWHNLLALVTAKKRRRPWGTVYDSVTKAPVDPAYVELFTEDGQKHADAITDLDGRYGFLVPEGMYTMKVRKTNYTFPTKRSLGGQDVIYSHLYYGGSLDVSATVAHDIPMDPVNFDWNQYEKLRTKQTRYFHLLDPLIVRFFDFAFFLGVGLMLWQFLRDMTLTTSLLLGCYCILLLARFFGARPVLYGSITEKGLPLQFALVRIMQGNTTILTKVTDAEGRYAVLVSPDTYTVRIEKRVNDTEYVPVFERKVRARKGVINERLRV